MRGHVLADLGGVDVEVDELRVRGELVEFAGDAVVEAGADREDQVGFVHRVVGGAGAVHAEHAEPLLVRGREGAEAVEGAGDGEVAVFGELADLVLGTGGEGAAADVEHGALGGREGAGGLADLLHVALELRLVAGEVDGRVLADLVGDVGLGEVGGDVDDDGAGTSGAGDVERLVDRLGDLGRVGDHPGVLDGRHGDAEDVGLLEAVGAEEVGAHLAGDEDDGDGVHHRVHDRRDEVGGAGAGGAEADGDLAGGLGVALGGVAAAGLVAHEHVADAGVDEGVVRGEVGAARVAEYDFDALSLEAFHDGVDGSHKGASGVGGRGAVSRVRYGAWCPGGSPGVRRNADGRLRRRRVSSQGTNQPRRRPRCGAVTGGCGQRPGATFCPLRRGRRRGARAARSPRGRISSSAGYSSSCAHFMHLAW